jgi:REP element-mobilizing transposase RayT
MGERINFVQGRKDMRIPGFDYGQPGGYFVTVCAEGRRPIFGEINQQTMVLNDCGEIVKNCWLWLESHYPYVKLDEFCIMPNHFHGIIFISDIPRRGGSRAAPTCLDKVKPLGQLVGAFKTTSTRRMNQIKQTPGMTIWQRSYYEHIIRDDMDLGRIRQYILDNPLRWSQDQENPQILTVRR